MAHRPVFPRLGTLGDYGYKRGILPVSRCYSGHQFWGCPLRRVGGACNVRPIYEVIIGSAEARVRRTDPAWSRC